MRLITIVRSDAKQSPSQSADSSYEGNHENGFATGTVRSTASQAAEILGKQIPQGLRATRNSKNTELVRHGTTRLFPAEQRVHLCHHLEGVGDIEHIRFAACPSAIRVEIDGAPFANKAPTNRVRLLPMTACGQSLGMSRRRAGLPDLVEMRHEMQRRLILAADIDQRFAATQRRLGAPQKIHDDDFCFGNVRLPIFLFLRPSRACGPADYSSRCGSAVCR